MMSEDSKSVTFFEQLPVPAMKRRGFRSPGGVVNWTEYPEGSWYTEQFSGHISTGHHTSTYTLRLRQAHGELVTGPLDTWIHTRRFKRGSLAYAITDAAGWQYHFTDDVGMGGYVGDFPLPVDEAAHVSTVTNSAIGLLLSKWMKMRRLLTGVLAAEATKTVALAKEYVTQANSLFRSSADRVSTKLKRLEAKASTARARGRPIPRRHLLRRIVDVGTQEHIKLHFGLLPLVSDLEGLAEASRARGLQDTRAKKIRAAVRTVEGAVSGPQLYATDPAYTGSRFSLTRRVRRSVHVKLLTKVGVLGIPEMNLGGVGALGIHPRDLAISIWELIPWSWLIDYVSNAGMVVDAVSQFTGIPAVTQITTAVVTHDEQSCSFDPQTWDGWSVLYRSFRPGKLTRRTQRITRAIQGGVPLPTFEVRNNFTAHKAGMLASVAWHVNRRREHVGRVTRLLSLAGTR